MRLDQAATTATVYMRPLLAAAAAAVMWLQLLTTSFVVNISLDDDSTAHVPWKQYTGLCLSEEEPRGSSVVRWLPNEARAGNATCPADLSGPSTSACHSSHGTCHVTNRKIDNTTNGYVYRCDDGYQCNTYLSDGYHGTDVLDAGVLRSPRYAVATALLSAYMVWFWALTRRLSGPRMWPLVGSLPSVVLNRARVHDWIVDNLRSTGESATYQTCIMPLPFLARRQGLVTVTCNARNLEHILRARFDNYPKGPQWQAAFHDLLGQGIFNSDGETWLLQRKTAALEFTTRTLRQAMARWANRIIKDRLWSILADHSGEGAASVDLQDLLVRLTFDNICGLTFGKDPETLSPGLQENPFANAFDSATEATLLRLLFPSFLWRVKKALVIGSERSLRESLATVDQYMTEAIAARKATPSDDLLSRFMKRRDGNVPEDDVLQWIALNFVLAGRDTSSVALSWFFWTLTLRRDVERKVVLEMAAVLRQTRGDDDGTGRWTEEPLDFDELDRLVYLKAALAETLRLYPSVPQDSKYVVEDDVLPDGTVVPAGSAITYSIYSVGRMESIWGKDCAEFRPEHWLSADGTRFEPAKDAYRFVAFNAGPRTCLGKDLAYLQMKSIASAVLLRHSVELVPGHKVEHKMSLTLFMKDGLRMHVKPRYLDAYVAAPPEEALQQGGAFVIPTTTA